MTRACVDFVTFFGRKWLPRAVAARVLSALVMLLPPSAMPRAADELAALDAVSKEAPAAILQEMRDRNPVVARVDGRDIRWLDVLNATGDLAIMEEDEARALFPVLLEQTIDRELLAAAARRDGLAQDERLLADVRRYEDDLLGRLYIDRVVAQASDRAELWDRYQTRIDALGGKVEMRARHIIVATREDALAMIQALEEGASFAELAARHSIGPSAARGGDLGYFDPARMVAPFSQAALQLRPGQHSPAPVKTPFGWHVIELVDLRQEGAVPFTALEAELRAEAEAEARQGVMHRLRAESQIEILSQGLREP